MGPKKMRMMLLLADPEVTVVAVASVEAVLRLTVETTVEKSMAQAAVRPTALAKRTRKRMTTQNILSKQRVRIFWSENSHFYMKLRENTCLLTKTSFPEVGNVHRCKHQDKTAARSLRTCSHFQGVFGLPLHLERMPYRKSKGDPL